MRVRNWSLIHRWAVAAVATTAVAACDPEPRGEPNERVQEVISAETPIVRLPDGDTVHLSEPVIAFYRERGYRQAWTDYDEVLDRGLALLETMARSAEDGLDPQQYRHPVAERMLREVEEDSLEESEEPGQMGALDMVLSEVFARYATHLTGGALDPEAAGLDWQIPKAEPDVGALLRRLAQDTPPQAVVDSLRPRAPEYRRMITALARYREIEQAGGWPRLDEGELPDVGETAPLIGLLRQRLIAERDPFEGELAGRGAAAPNTFDEALKEALVHFQERHGLDADGVLGRATLASLNTPVTQRIEELKLNLDRWRWLPRDLGELYVMVNVAGFELEVVERDSALLTMNVVVGQQAWRTPIFRDTMEHIVVNPFWNVPPSIQQEEVIPAVMRDPDYLERNGFEVLRGDTRVAIEQVDWSALESGSPAYRIRQKPGRSNALGSVKFLFPNPDDIYLHDTPAGHLFSQTSRAFSHGCIRVEKPRELAELLFTKATDRPASAFQELRAREGEQWVKLTRPVPVYILYFTAYAHRDDTVSFHPDIYERDRRLQERTLARTNGSQQRPG